MSCVMFRSGELLACLCSADAMWDDPASPGLAAHLNLVSEQQWRDNERELDLQREHELYPEEEAEAPDVVPAELVLDWDAYGG